MDATESMYADIINRYTAEYENMPGGKPPGFMIESALLTNQEVYPRLNEGDLYSGVFYLGQKGEESEYFRARYGREINWTNVNDSVAAATAATYERKQKGGAFDSWVNASAGISGFIDELGMKRDLSADEVQRGGSWWKTFENRLKKAANNDEKKDAIKIPDGITKYREVDGELIEVVTFKSPDDAISDVISTALDLNWIRDFVAEWALRGTLLVLGIFILLYGVKLFMKG